MSGIFGALNINDTDRVFLSTLGQRVVYDAIQQVLDQHNADLAAAMGVFVEQTTSDHKLRYKLPGGGRLQRLGTQGPSGAVKAYGSWDVAFPLEGFGAQMAGNRIDMAYMTTQDLDRHLNTIMQQDINTVRFEMLKALLNSGQDTFVDPMWGSLSIEPLANGDSVTYPPVLGSETEATENHYLGAAYAAAAISDTNNPYTTIRDELEEHFGAAQGGSNIVTFINNAQVSVTEALTDFDPVNDRYTNPAITRDTLTGLPASLPGRVVGRTNGVWVVEWRFIPATWLLAVHLDAPKPLIQRVDPADTGLPQGLALVAQDEEHPITSSYYEHRFGFGVGNRLNGVALDLSNADSDYDIPTAYA
jgi:hypothetical protein